MLYEYYVSCVIRVCLERVECRGDSVWVSQVVECGLLWGYLGRLVSLGQWGG